MKRIVSLVIVITMMLCMLPISNITASATTATQIDLSNYADGDTYTDAKGVKYEVIRTASNFKAIDRTKNCIFACDIDMGKEAFESNIFGNGSSIQGIIDGNGYALHNFSTNYTGTYGAIGLLAQSLKGNATVRNLTIGTATSPITYDINGSSAYIAGALVGKIDKTTTAEQTVTISNVHVYCNITFKKAISNGVCLGGLVGTTESGDYEYTLDISNCSYTGSIAFADTAEISGQNTRVGGLVGYHQKGTLNIKNSSSNVNIDTTKRPSGSNLACAGGIVGLVQSTASFENCTTFGNVISNCYSGGIVGAVYFSNSAAQGQHEFSFSKCINHADITAIQSGTTKNSAGGIAGNLNFGRYEISDCGNTGDISASTTYACSTPNPVGASGIAGYCYVNTENAATISNCFSLGNITATGDYGDTKIAANAICSVSAAGKAFTVTNCVYDMTYNNAKVTSVASGKVTLDDTNAQKNLLAKETSDTYEACVQKSTDNTKLRVLLLSSTDVLPSNTNVVINVYCGNTGKQFTVPASEIFALESVNAAGETLYGVGGTYIFGAVITGIPTGVMDTVTDVTVEYGSYTCDIDMTK